MRRPCERLPAEWWDSEDAGARLALALCRACPGLPGCDAGRQWGVVRAGVAWSERGHVLPMCRCGYPNLRRESGSTGRVPQLCRRCDPKPLRPWNPSPSRLLWMRYDERRKAAA